MRFTKVSRVSFEIRSELNKILEGLRNIKKRREDLKMSYYNLYRAIDASSEVSESVREIKRYVNNINNMLDEEINFINRLSYIIIRTMELGEISKDIIE